MSTHGERDGGRAASAEASGATVTVRVTMHLADGQSTKERAERIIARARAAVGGAAEMHLSRIRENVPVFSLTATPDIIAAVERDEETELVQRSDIVHDATIPPINPREVSPPD